MRKTFKSPQNGPDLLVVLQANRSKLGDFFSFSHIETAWKVGIESGFPPPPDAVIAFPECFFLQNIDWLICTSPVPQYVPPHESGLSGTAFMWATPFKNNSLVVQGGLGLTVAQAQRKLTGFIQHTTT